ncbi:clp protease adapter protein ClpF, chloroplastic isoform X1 [Syzygium oleosum]|uniref:clp protease adapter protein ClpF, chloroplastic isoform X1 n=1 Tax=Syzygium oleosum TaxID=219896 RepID=UPI0011D2B4EA|nr:clp protease adapter protein ClpF, chloroplastic isoform X1 [Syzygium oleosum]XP_056164768.1 clp protease adapter protein ClpF, chloroplastic isoform X1 [Syzygium oleosum]XP_056164770.1 clp protease adapter protein ClpF, chloroplastic isoform X1 [Syzygium oleosum]
MLALSLSSATASAKSGVYATDSSWRRQFDLTKRTFATSGSDGQSSQCRCMQSFSFSANLIAARQRKKVAVRAGWLFKGGEKGLDASAEQSESANEDILMFFFQLDLATRVQYALNLEQYDIAQQLRNKLTEVETEVIKQQEAKRGSSSKSEAQDKAISIIRLRADLQKAVEREDYELASKLRDEISNLEADSLAASAKALAYENAQYAFRLGQKVKHKVFGYRAVVCGMDPVCCESNSWMEAAQIQKLDRGSNQPFYQVLVDVYEDPNLLVTYVPEENLVAPDQPDKDRFDHPYISILFYGMDGAGDFIPIKQLREKYNRPRHEVPIDPKDPKYGDIA